MAQPEAADAVKGWTCRRIHNGVRCRRFNPARKKKCLACGKPRPRKRRPAHRAVLDEVPYAVWVEHFGTVCNICGAPPKGRRLHRDHDHHTGQARGLLCFRCNTALPNRVDPQWLRAAAGYLERSQA